MSVSGRYTNTVVMSYDEAGRLETEDLTIAGQTYSVQREYDSLSRLSKMIYPATTSFVERDYTDRGQLNQIKYTGNVVDTRTYDPGGRLATSTYGNGVVTTHSYRDSGGNKDNLLASITTTNPGPPKMREKPKAEPVPIPRSSPDGNPEPVFGTPVYVPKLFPKDAPLPKKTSPARMPGIWVIPIIFDPNFWYGPMEPAIIFEIEK